MGIAEVTALTGAGTALFGAIAEISGLRGGRVTKRDRELRTPLVKPEQWRSDASARAATRLGEVSQVASAVTLLALFALKFYATEQPWKGRMLLMGAGSLAAVPLTRRVAKSFLNEGPELLERFCAGMKTPEKVTLHASRVINLAFTLYCSWQLRNQGNTLLATLTATTSLVSEALPLLIPKKYLVVQ